MISIRNHPAGHTASFSLGKKTQNLNDERSNTP